MTNRIRLLINEGRNYFADGNTKVAFARIFSALDELNCESEIIAPVANQKPCMCQQPDSPEYKKAFVLPTTMIGDAVEQSKKRDENHKLENLATYTTSDIYRPSYLSIDDETDGRISITIQEEETDLFPGNHSSITMFREDFDKVLISLFSKFRR